MDYVCLMTSATRFDKSNIVEPEIFGFKTIYIVVTGMDIEENTREGDYCMASSDLLARYRSTMYA